MDLSARRPELLSEQPEHLGVNRTHGMKAPRGETAFLQHYQRVFSERWPALLQALERTPRRVLRENAFFVARDGESQAFEPVPDVPGCYEASVSERQSIDIRDREGFRRFYSMDAASVVAARALTVARGERVMDMCAAPGGKSLVLAEALQAEGELVLNDRSKHRLGRLKRVLDDYVPPGFRATIKLSCRDGKHIGLALPDHFDAILLDAPCSSERHVLSDRGEIAKWSPGRIKRLSVEQFGLLSSAFLALKPGGRLVYCTCALLPEENDDVVERLLERRTGAITIDSVDVPVGERTRYGWQIWPDRGGLGPIYFSRLTKV